MKKTLYIFLLVFLGFSLNIGAQRRPAGSPAEKKEKSVVRQTRPVQSRSGPSQAAPRREEAKNVQRPVTPSRQAAQELSGSRTASPSRSNTRIQNTAESNSSRRSPAYSENRRTEPQREGTVRRSGENLGTRSDAIPRVDSRRSSSSRHYSPGQTGVYHSEKRYNYSRPVKYHYRVIPESRAYRARHFVYRVPVFVNVHWSTNLYHRYSRYYPVISYWGYNPHYVIQTISAYDAWEHVGHVRSVYGQVSETYYFPETDEYFLYIGAYFPHHDFTVILPGEIARRFSGNPGRYFTNRDFIFTGLITEYDRKAEMTIHEKSQINRY